MYKKHPYLFQCIIFIGIAVLLSYFANKIHFERRAVIMNFVVILSGFILPINYAVSCGIITPIICCIWYGVPDVYPQLLLTICLMTAYTSFANIFYNSAKWSVYPSLLSTLIMGGTVLFSTASILSWVTDGFSAISYVVQTFVDTIPGLLLQIALLPLIIKIYEYLKRKNRVDFSSAN